MLVSEVSFQTSRCSRAALESAVFNLSKGSKKERKDFPQGSHLIENLDSIKASLHLHIKKAKQMEADSSLQRVRVNHTDARTPTISTTSVFSTHLERPGLES